ncbi:MAG: Cof-type HAD-IIB family hydrolase [Clostridia bacterium]|nr:Cof-type HAD-IIB family hydrolase [Clostridia bacterium]MBR6523308.1 Cof-type HAD-IIB family hydrolase [Clostridia bacterium]
MNNYKLIACDLDGTLIGSDLTLSKENYQAIKELTEQGVLIVPTTGRTICEMEDVFNLPEIRYVIYSNGAAIFDKQTGEKIFLGLDDSSSRFVSEVLEKYDVFTVIHKDGKTYADKEKAQRLYEYHVCLNVECLVKDVCILEENFKNRFLDGGIESVAIFFASKDEMEECREIIASNPDLYAVEGWDYNMEIFFRDAGKGNALKKLVKKLNIEMKNVISIGDSDNDRQMTILSGLGLVAQNGCESLKKVADKVICTNDEHVMSYVKKYYFDK